MNINAVSKSIGLYFVLIFSVMAVLIFNKYSLTERPFTIFLLASALLVGFYTGKNARENAGVNGFLLGIITSVLLIFIVSMYADMHWELNFMIMVVWVSISVLGSFIGGRVSYLYHKASEKLATAKPAPETE